MGNTTPTGNTTDPSVLRTLAEQLARRAGELALDGRRSVPADGTLIDDTKSSRTDLVTEFDRAAERLIVDALLAVRPDDAIVGEEGTDHSGTSGYEWYLDPIDGTTNFVYDQPAWACSIGVAHHGSMVAGAVYVPPLDEMFSAAAGAGARLNDATIRPSGESDLSLALVGTGFGYSPDRRRRQAEVVTEMIAHVRDVRRLGSAAFDLCMVACGRLDVYYELNLNPWDSAAGELIARESGAITSDFDGGEARHDEIVAAAPGIHRAFIGLLESLPTGPR